jgi:predicted transcriptional regulator
MRQQMKGYNIRQIMADNKVKVTDIAKDMDVTHVAVSNVIHGKSKSARIQRHIATKLNRPVSDLWPEE